MFVLKHATDGYIVQIGCDICCTDDLEKADSFETSDVASEFKDQWDLWDWEVKHV
ncbi:hypothetical protein VPFG_00159 [Vibrio phage nt-1]|uniref:Uncharacterized protein n=1 Tax=Vibrio phage nt-1 TaxID=115992 RepID=R9TEI1_9CAUD|nr:hypothetical protein VPFG_00159 [Vibrio phage nt-1]AGN30161.1 hypothetical protein VPFG_00159 [Vibrio phage nt-1]